MGSIRQGIVVMAKRPTAGAVKTRLCPPLTFDQAAALADAFLRDTVASAQSAGGGEVAIAYAPADAGAWFAGEFPGLPLLAQSGADLGARLTDVFAQAWQRRFQPCVVIGTDCPFLPPARLRAAFAALQPGADGQDVALGPADDGGYYLIGLKWRAPGLFRNIAWSSDQVLAQTLDRARALNLRTRLLESDFDVDTGADLERLQMALALAPPETAPATRACLSEFARSGALAFPFPTPLLASR